MKKSSILFLMVAIILPTFIGLDWGTAEFYAASGTVSQKFTIYEEVGGTIRRPIYYVEVATDKNIGYATSAKVSAEQFNSIQEGQKIEIDIVYGGITGINYYNIIQ